ncbi:LOW QUALITY PROTEIN: sensor histidine kinase, HAMP domain-containing [Citrifermentans bemidjiense Bem]|uniref:histidine kinase n=1 Tax=Citrifermentans bemidjiense (strain ATCC BAA-1014 / DSM 16622 / JCM 12645 / Bem) TaxID=404380 RepID=E1P6D9_CITBB|nr:LOW QUALITY PROTEIN: sensor histidine kinase, HAMP domain-containing [Citrifermentans bemidjiense Bem]
MKIMIKYRLLIAMLAATGAVVVSMFLIMQWSIGRGFLAYVNTMEEDRLGRLAQVLERAYQANGSWDFVKDDNATWSKLVAASRETSDLDRTEHGERRMTPPPPPFPNLSGHPLPPRFQYRFEGRVLLLDAQKVKVIGMPSAQEAAQLHKITSSGSIVGYVGLRPRQRLTDNYQLLFVKQQKLTMGLVAVVMFLVSAAISLPLAHRLVLPIKRLAASMHRLASGEYSTRVAVGPEDELGQLARDFNTLALTLENNERARRRWVADVSHELRTPLAILRGEIEAIQDGVRQAGPESMRSLHGEVMHLSRLVDDLYQISLYDIGALTYRKESIDLKEVLEDALAMLGQEFVQKGINLSIELPRDDGCSVFADPDRLGQLFSNLLDNSLKYTDAGGKLSVRLSCRENLALVEFADSAPGVAPDQLERLFDRLYRVESSRNRAKGGAGLGLAICKNIVEAHEGTISALPSPHGGVLIRVELPLTGSRT